MAPTQTQREMDALRAICKPGGFMASAATELEVSTHAVHKRLLRLYGRLDVQSAAQAPMTVGSR